MTRAGVVCVGNAGRSQMATALAERERDRRGLEDSVTIVTGGIDSHEHVHSNVVEALQKSGIDISDRTPHESTVDDAADAAYVVTMRCSVEESAPEGGTEPPNGEISTIPVVTASTQFRPSTTRSSSASRSASIESISLRSN